MNLALDTPEVAKTSLFKLLEDAKADVLEAKLLLAEVIRGNVSGSEFFSYPACDKGCILGTLAIMRDGEFIYNSSLSVSLSTYEVVGKVLGLPQNRFCYDIEGYIGDITYGDTPETHERLAHVRDWLVEWIVARGGEADRG